MFLFLPQNGGKTKSNDSERIYFMNRLDLAFRSFFWIFLNKKFADKVNEHFDYVKNEETVAELPSSKAPEKKGRSEAVQLLSLLQREGRLVDFFKESISSYSDAQIGAAVRDIHRDCASLLTKIFAIEPLESKSEGDSIEIPPGYSPEKYHFTGNLSGNPPYKGVLRHPGWKITKMEMPVWNGNDTAVPVIAPAEVEL
jgi:hypothetical protein